MPIPLIAPIVIDPQSSHWTNGIAERACPKLSARLKQGELIVGRRMNLYAITLVLLSVAGLQAAPSADTLFPASTKGFVSIPDFQALQQRFGNTQLSQLFELEEVKPFAKDLRRQLQSKLSGANMKLGVTLGDFKGVASGELAMGLLQPGKEGTHAVLLTVEVKEDHKAANEMIEKLAARVLKEGGKRDQITSGTHKITKLTLPANQERRTNRTAFFIVEGTLLVASDDQSVAIASLSSGENPLSGVSAYQRSVTNAFPNEKDFQLKWFIEPIGYAELSVAAGQATGDGSIIKILKEEGFKGIEGAGGILTFAQGNHEILHRVRMVTNGKLTKSASMLELPNAEGRLDPQRWIPSDVGTYVSFQWKIKDAFERATPMVNKFLNAEPGEDLVKEIIDGIAKDPFGPKVDIKKEIIDYLDDRVTWITSNKEPIQPDSQRWAVAIRVKQIDKVRIAVEKVLKSEPTAVKREIEGGKYHIWEVLEEEGTVEEVEIGGFGDEDELDLDDEKEDEKRKPGLISTFAMTVVKDANRDISHILVGSHVDFLAALLTAKQNERLAAEKDYERVSTVLKQLGMTQQSVSQFNRLDKVFRISYELLRDGKMPESKTLFGKLLNRSLSSDDGTERKQEIDGKKMPKFEVVAPFLGPSGFAVKTEKDGWTMTSVLLRKE